MRRSKSKDNLAGLVQSATKAMTPHELMRFRRELARGLPDFVDQAATKAKQDNKQKRSASDE